MKATPEMIDSDRLRLWRVLYELEKYGILSDKTLKRLRGKLRRQKREKADESDA